MPNFFIRQDCETLYLKYQRQEINKRTSTDGLFYLPKYLDFNMEYYVNINLKGSLAKGQHSCNKENFHLNS